MVFSSLMRFCLERVPDAPTPSASHDASERFSDFGGSHQVTTRRTGSTFLDETRIPSHRLTVDRADMNIRSTPRPFLTGIPLICRSHSHSGSLWGRDRKPSYHSKIRSLHTHTRKPVNSVLSSLSLSDYLPVVLPFAFARLHVPGLR